MSILDRAALEESPLADLHAIASELSIDGYRRLRRAELVDAIVTRQGGAPSKAPADAEPDGDDDELTAAVADELRAHDEDQGRARRRRGRRGGRSRTAGTDDGSPVDAEEADATRAARPAGATRAARPSGTTAAARPAGTTGAARATGTTGAARPSGTRRAKPAEEPEEPAEQVVEGVVELLPNGSGFLRVHPPDASDDDVYVSAAQVKRCELVSGDRVSGPRRPPRRSERFASLVRVDAVNDRPASELAEGTRYDDLPVAFPEVRFRLGSEDPTVKAIEWLTPFGRGSRVTIVGPPRAGKTEALRRLAEALAGQEDVQLLAVLAGVRPEEIAEWENGPVQPTAAANFAASADIQDQTVEAVVDQARRLASRGGHVVVLIDTLEGMHPQAARKALAAARNIVDGGSLTIIATAPAAVGGETTVIALDALFTSTGRFPALDLIASWTIRPERLVGEAGAEAIARARGEAVGA